MTVPGMLQTRPTTDAFSTAAFHSGFLLFEELEGSELFVRRFFVLDRKSDRLEYFADNRQTLQKDLQGAQSLGHFNIHFISFISDASSTRPKLQNGFYIIVCGDRYFFSAPSEREKLDWIRILSDASRISIPGEFGEPSQPSEPPTNGCRVEIVGGVMHKTSVSAEMCSTPPIAAPPVCRMASSLRDSVGFIKAGFCTKQGAKRKNWKRRYFVLDAFALSYYSDMQDKSAIRVIRLKDILHARVSIGVHPTKQNVFEIVTPLRVFYLQADTATERDSWIEMINGQASSSTGPKVTSAAN